jgi:hypothetical protein
MNSAGRRLMEANSMSHQSISQNVEILQKWEARKIRKNMLPKPQSGILDKKQQLQLLEYIKHLAESKGAVS